ncbi:MAG TPA: aspartate carbamoyltransferase catalytic subunit [Clostridia bacterium]|nr:aspartate carbamoyltransferase catalytic subunit [Clostridia bacterium]
MSKFNKTSLLGISYLDAEEIKYILNLAKKIKNAQMQRKNLRHLLQNRIMVNLFFENSTRTCMSFETAAKKLGMDVISFQASTSSLAKGETILDTAKTIEALGPDLLTIRHSYSGICDELKKQLKIPVINAGDGWHEHPSQALLDIFTVGEVKPSYENLKVVIVGDITHSRVARSNIWGFQKLGAEVTVFGPPTLIPKGIEQMGVKVANSLQEALKDKDVVMVLRIQRERQEKGYFPSKREYANLYGINKDNFAYAKRDAILLHPGPVNYGVEVAHEMANHPRFLVNTQVSNGVFVRMALIYLLLGGELKDVVA